MSKSKENKAFFGGYSVGYKHAVADIKAELLEMENEGRIVPLPILEVINSMEKHNVIGE